MSYTVTSFTVHSDLFDGALALNRTLHNDRIARHTIPFLQNGYCVAGKEVIVCGAVCSLCTGEVVPVDAHVSDSSAHLGTIGNN